VRESGSAGGHNGLADVLAALGTIDVPRLRVGIGAVPGPMDAKDYVLSTFSQDEEAAIGIAVEQAAEAAEDWVFSGIRYVMDKYNRKPEP
jgi:PTH1 family peptidyl-tRNA hydrolase